MKVAGKYDVIGHIATGGMGKIWLARNPQRRLVVVKTSLSGNADDDQRLIDEARVGLRLHHPHVVETLDLVEHEGHPALVTAYVSGATLFELRRRGPLPPAVVCRIGRQIADALDAIHNAVDERGRLLDMLHRDVTPGNVMLGHDGIARLIDLGIVQSRESRAQRTEQGSVRGTIRYLAPELFSGSPHSKASDLWALGIVLWEALLGREAVEGTAAAAVGRICTGHVMVLRPGENIDPRLQKAIGQLLKTHPGDRPKRARDASALFAMLEKDLARADDITSDAAALVLERVGPRQIDREDNSVELVSQAKSTLYSDLPIVHGTSTPSGALTLDDDAMEIELLDTDMQDASASYFEFSASEGPFGEFPPSGGRFAEFSPSGGRFAELPPDLPRVDTPQSGPQAQLLDYVRMLASLESSRAK